MCLHGDAFRGENGVHVGVIMDIMSTWQGGREDEGYPKGEENGREKKGKGV